MEQNSKQYISIRQYLINHVSFYQAVFQEASFSNMNLKTKQILGSYYLKMNKKSYSI